MPLTIYRRGEIYHYRGTVAGRRLRGSCRTKDKATAERIAHEKEGRHWKGHLDGPASVLTFAQAAMLYRDADKSDRYLKPVEDYWKNTPVKNITAGAVRQSSLTLYPGTGPATRNRHVIVPTQAVINHAAELELCPPLRVKRYTVVKKEKEPATWTWIEAFMAAAIAPPARNYRVAALACFMFLTAARVGEAVALDWEDVDLVNGRALIRQTKVDDERLARLPEVLIVALANIPGDRSGPVFGYAHPHNAKTQWFGAIRRAGIKRLTYHSCRHGFATGLLRKGVNPMDVAKRGGWKSTHHVFATYGHATEDEAIVDLLIDTPETQQRQKRNAIK